MQHFVLFLLFAVFLGTAFGVIKAIIRSKKQNLATAMVEGVEIQPDIKLVDMSSFALKKELEEKNKILQMLLEIDTSRLSDEVALETIRCQMEVECVLTKYSNK